MKDQVRLYLWLMLAITTFLMSCNPEPLPTPVEEEPELVLEGQIANNPLNWQAGLDGMFNYSESALNDWNYWELSSTMKSRSWDLTKPYFSVQIMDQTDFDQSFNPELRFQEGDREMVSENDWISSYTFKLSPQFNGSVSSIEWDIAGIRVTEEEPTFDFSQPGSHLVCLKIVTSYYDTIHTCKRINMSGVKTYEPKLSISRQTNDSVFVSAEVAHKVCDQWVWDGSSTYAYQHGFDKAQLLQDDIHHLQVMSEGEMVTDILFQLSDADSDGDYNADVVQFESERLDVEIKNDQHGKLVVDYFDPANGLYSSRFYQGTNGHLTILDKEVYEENQNQEPTMKVAIEGMVHLSTEFGETITLELDKAVLAFPNPQ